MMNSVVEKYLKTGMDLLTILESTGEHRSPLVHATLQLRQFLAGKPGSNGAFLAARNVSVEGADANLFLLFLISWAQASFLQSSFAKDRLVQAWALASKAQNLLADTTPPEIVADLKGVIAALTGASGNRLEQEKILDEALRLIPAHSPRRVHALLNFAELHALTGRLGTLERQLTACSFEQPNRSLGARLSLYRFINAVEICSWTDAATLDPNVEEAHLPEPYLALLRRYRQILQLLKNRATVNSDADTAFDPETQDWGLVLRCLLHEHPENALRWARISEKHSRESVTGVGWVSYNLVRAELASLHPSAAERVMQLRHHAGNSHYLDPLFYARVAQLQGDRESAHRLLGEAIVAGRQHHAEQRLALELRMAPDIPRDLLLEQVFLQPTRTPTESRESDRPTAVPPQVPSPPASAEAIPAIVGRSDGLSLIRKQVLQLAPLDVPVLVTGETGTGKELIARAIHEASPRHAQPFLAVNCGAISEPLLESELFGHEKGSFSGAASAHRGLFEEAAGGTLLLDEIGEIPPRLQVALLRVMETGEIRPVGSAKTRTASCRIVAATNVDLAALVGKGLFRKDLFYRLRRMAIHIPPLRSRTEDIIPLAYAFLNADRQGGGQATLSSELCDALLRHPWHGNVRELRNTIERMRLLNSDKLHYELADLDLQETDTSPWNTAVTHASPTGARPEVLSPVTPQPEAHPDMPWYLNKRSPLRVEERLRRLFQEHTTLTRQEVMKALGISTGTATAYLKALCQEGTITRVAPTRSPRSVFFRLADPGRTPSH